MVRAPTFVFSAGSVKAGTSWLYEYLESHPEAHVRTVKEVRFFDRLEQGGLDHRARRLLKDVEALRDELARKPKWPRYVERRLADRRELAAVMAAGTVAAYRDYMAKGAGDKKIVLDMTPEYGLLPLSRMRQMMADFPGARWVFLMRDPVSRLWSHVRMLTQRSNCAEADVGRVSAEIFENTLAGRATDVVERSDYAGIYRRLIEAVAPENRLVFYYERFITPAGVGALTRFLGLSNAPARFDRRAHKGMELAMPAPFRARARAFLARQYAFVADIWGIPAEWEPHPELKQEVVDGQRLAPVVL